MRQGFRTARQLVGGGFIHRSSSWQTLRLSRTRFRMTAACVSWPDRDAKRIRGIDSHFGPPAIDTGLPAYPLARSHLTLQRPSRSAPHERHRPGRERRPSSPRAWYGFGGRCVLTNPPPRPRGSRPSSGPLARRPQRAAASGAGSTDQSGLRVSTLAGQVHATRSPVVVAVAAGADPYSPRCCARPGPLPLYKRPPDSRVLGFAWTRNDGRDWGAHGNEFTQGG